MHPQTTTAPPEPTTAGQQVTVGELLTSARRRLARADFAPPPREASLLLGYVLGWGEARLLARDDQRMTAAAHARFEELLERRLQGEPTAYLLGEREFHGRAFRVDSRVLIPRPETEHLVEAALALDLPEAPRILDIGSGSGCIAVTLALEIPQARVVASDLSIGALEVLRDNAARHGVEARVRPLLADLTGGVRLDQFDLVVSNPPYVNPSEEEEVSFEVIEFEPHLALFANDFGRSILQRLLRLAHGLRPRVHLLLEIGYDQSEWLRAAVAAEQHLQLEDIVRDYAGIGRTAILRRIGHEELRRQEEPCSLRSTSPAAS